MDDILRWAASVGTIGIAGGPKSARTGWALLFNCFVGTREKRRRDREAERRSLGGLHGLAGGLAGSSASRAKKCFRPKVQNSFWITEDKFSRLWTRRTNNRVGDCSNPAAALLTDQFVRSKTVPPRERR